EHRVLRAALQRRLGHREADPARRAGHHDPLPTEVHDGPTYYQGDEAQCPGPVPDPGRRDERRRAGEHAGPRAAGGRPLLTPLPACQRARRTRVACDLVYHRYGWHEPHGGPMLAGFAPEVLIPSVAAATTQIRVGSG